MRDVTEARRREAVRETFIGVLSHELRTPVTTIFGGAKLLARERRRSTRRPGRGIFRTSTRRPSDCSDSSRTSSPSTGSARTPATSAGSRSSSSGWCRVWSSPRRAAGRGDFRLDIASGLPPHRRPDVRRTGVRNLLSNAAKYGGRLHGHSGRRARRGRGARPVFDDGPGFPAEERPDCSSCSTVRLARPRKPAAPGSGCSSVRGWWPRWEAGFGPRLDRTAAPSSASRCPS